MYTPCQIKELDLGCFGCCGRYYAARKEVEKDIVQNTQSWDKNKQTNKLSLKEFCWRQKPLHTSGVCPNVVKRAKRFMCAVHPQQHDEEVRAGYCDAHYLCKAAKAYGKMSEPERKKYHRFLKQKIAQGMDSYEYSMLNDDDKLIEEYERSHELAK